MRLIPLLPALLALAVPAVAVDGVLEINQTCAVETGCFPGDAPAFPVTIDTAGSYRLTGNLDLRAEGLDTHGIEVTGFGGAVAVDLNGFEIVGPCPSGPACGGSGSGAGVRHATTVRNGTVRNMAFHGLDLGNHARVDRVRAIDNGRDGVSTAEHSQLTHVIASGNGEDGIVVFFGEGLVRNCVSNNNGRDGIVFFSGDGHGVIESSVANHNGGAGIRISPDRESVLIRANSISGNVGTGIKAPARGVAVIDNTVSGNQFHGIEVGARSLVKGNTSNENTLDGINVSGPGVRIEHNAIGMNGDDGVQATSQAGCSVTHNTVTGNAFGLFIDASTVRGGNIISGSTGNEVLGGGLLLECDMVAGVRVCPP